MRFFSVPLCQVHAYIISSLKKEMPSVFGKDTKKKELVNNLAEIYGRIEREHQISPGDFPNLKRMQVMRVRDAMEGDSVALAGCQRMKGQAELLGETQSRMQGDDIRYVLPDGPLLTASAIAKPGRNSPASPKAWVCLVTLKT